MSWTGGRVTSAAGLAQRELDALAASLLPNEWVQVAACASVFLEGEAVRLRHPVGVLVTERALVVGARKMLSFKSLRFPADPIDKYAVQPLRGVGPTWEYAWFGGHGPWNSLYFETEEDAQAVAFAVNAAVMHVRGDFLLLRPGSPEHLAGDPEATKAAQDGLTRESIAELVQWYRQQMASDEPGPVWEQACAIGPFVEEGLFGDQATKFWFYACPALAGLRLGRPKTFPLQNFCAMADMHVSSESAQQQEAYAVIEAAFFGRQ